MGVSVLGYSHMVQYRTHRIIEPWLGVEGALGMCDAVSTLGHRHDMPMESSDRQLVRAPIETIFAWHCVISLGQETWRIRSTLSFRKERKSLGPGSLVSFFQKIAGVPQSSEDRRSGSVDQVVHFFIPGGGPRIRN